MSSHHPDYPVLCTGALHAPYFVFLRETRRPTDHEMLRMLCPRPRSAWRRMVGAPAYVRTPPSDREPKGEHVYIGEQGGWVMVADDWHDHVWHQKDRLHRVERLAARWEVYEQDGAEVVWTAAFAVGVPRVHERVSLRCSCRV